MSDAQTFSHFPTWPLPLLGVERLVISDRQPCGYLPGRLSTFRAFEVTEGDARSAPSGISGSEYQRLMDTGFRRSGTIIYQPMCAHCRACVPLRVPVATFQLSRSQRRVLRTNKDVVVQVARPEPTREKWEMYDAYQQEWHGKKPGDEDIARFVQFLYRSPVETAEFEYRDRWGKLLAVGICDICPETISSVYFYFDPREAWRSLGTFGALYELQWARQMKLQYWYAGYWIKECPSMAYKARFRPCQILGTDGIWRECAAQAAQPTTGPAST